VVLTVEVSERAFDAEEGGGDFPFSLLSLIFLSLTNILPTFRTKLNSLPSLAERVFDSCMLSERPDYSRATVSFFAELVCPSFLLLFRNSRIPLLFVSNSDHPPSWDRIRIVVKTCLLRSHACRDSCRCVFWTTSFRSDSRFPLTSKSGNGFKVDCK